MDRATYESIMENDAILFVEPDGRQYSEKEREEIAFAMAMDKHIVIWVRPWLKETFNLKPVFTRYGDFQVVHGTLDEVKKTLAEYLEEPPVFSGVHSEVPDETPQSGGLRGDGVPASCKKEETDDDNS